jgi:Tol biopolymer transport system component
VAPSFDGPIYFELVKNGASTTMTFDPGTRQAVPATLPPPATTEGLVISPDGKWIAFESMQAGPKQIWLRESASGKTKVAVGGDCNSSSPAWENSHSLIFASDCGRGLGMPVLYRASFP